MEQEKEKSNVLHVLLLYFVAFLGLGTAGFVIFKDMAVWDALYFSLIILITHIPHQIEEPLAIQIIILALILGSFAIVAYILKFLAEYFFEGTFKENRRKKVMKKTIASYENHIIICGFGRVGKQIAEELHAERANFVIIDRDPKERAAAINKGFPVVEGDPTEEGTVLKAGILKAKALIAAAGNDIDNLYIILSARSLNPDIYLVARCSREESIPKLKKAGADRVTMPEQLSGYHMASMALRPSVIDFLDIIVDGKHDELKIEELQIQPGSEFVNKPLSAYLYQANKNINVLAISRSDGATKINPQGDEILGINDKLILMGGRMDLEEVVSHCLKK